jgi:hypothetical protein
VKTRSSRAAIAALAAAAAAPAVLLFAGCTSSAAGPSESSSASSTPTGTVATTGSSPPSSSSTPMSPSASVTSSSAVSTAPPTSRNLWPTDLTPEQIAQAQAAIAAYVGYYKLVDQAYAAPGNDWSADAARRATDPVKSSFLNNLAGTAELGQYRTGSVAVYPTVTKVEPGLVTMSI